MKPTMVIEFENGLFSPELPARALGAGKYVASYAVPIDGLTPLRAFFRHPELFTGEKLLRLSSPVTRLRATDVFEMIYIMNVEWRTT